MEIKQKKEFFDAYDINGNLLDKTIERGMPHDEGLYHIVVEIITLNHKNEVLITKRHLNKIYGGFHEITGGSVLKGETDIMGAKRELYEETGIKADSLIPIYEDIYYDGIFRGFLAKVDTDQVNPQMDEVMDYQWIHACDFIETIMRDDFIPHTRKRILKHWIKIESILFKDEPCE